MSTRHFTPRAGRAAAAVIGPLLLAAAIVATLGLHGCGKPGPSAIPTVDLSKVEPALATRIEERRAAVENAPNNAEAWGRLGVAFDAHGYVDEAITCYEKATALDGEIFVWQYLLGFALRDRDPSLALARLQRADELRSDYAPVATLIGLLQLEAGQIDAADDSFARSLGLDDDMVATLLGRARVSLAREDGENALFYLERAFNLTPRTGEISALLAEAHRMADHPDQAMRFTALAGDDWQPEPLDDPIRDELLWNEGVTMEWRRRRSNAYVASGEVDKFVTEWQNAMREQPTSAVPHIELGRAYGAVENYDMAIDSFDSAIALEPTNAAAHYNRGRALSLLGQTDDGVAAIRKAIEFDPRLRDARRALAAELIRAGDVEDALEVLRQGVELAPEDVDAHLDLGVALRQQGRRDEAIEVLDRALAIDPGHTQSLFERAIIKGAEGDFEAAIAGFERAAAEAPTVPGAHLNLGQAYLALGRTAEAIEALRRGVAIHPNHRPLLRALAWIYATNPEAEYRNGQVGVRIAQHLVGLTRQSNPNDLDVLAAAAAERGDFEVAARYASSAIKLMSDRLEKESDPAVVQQIEQWIQEVQARLELYLENQPYRDMR